jgi:Leucine-rich repeat (LRR) protein
MEIPENEIPIKLSLEVSAETFKKLFPYCNSNELSLDVAINVTKPVFNLYSYIQSHFTAPHDKIAELIKNQHLGFYPTDDDCSYFDDWQSWHDEVSPVDLLNACDIGDKKEIKDLRKYAKCYSAGVFCVNLRVTFINKDEASAKAGNNQLKFRFQKQNRLTKTMELTEHDAKIIDILCGGYPELAETLCESQGVDLYVFLKHHGYFDIKMRSAQDFLKSRRTIALNPFFIKIPRLPISIKILQIYRNEKLNMLPDLRMLLNLDRLLCSNNILEELPALPPNLTFLNCCCNNLSEICDLPIDLEHLDCSYNPLSKLSLPPNLKQLDCSYCNLAELPELPKSLKELRCAGNRFKLTNVQAEELKEKGISVYSY